MVKDKKVWQSIHYLTTNSNKWQPKIQPDVEKNKLN